MAEQGDGSKVDPPQRPDRRQIMGVGAAGTLAYLMGLGSARAQLGGDSYIGAIIPVAFNFAPRNFALCNGQLLAISQNTALFSLLGTTFGGNGQTTFALPDLRGRTPVGAGSGFQLGQMAGEENHTLLATEMPAHTHSINATTSAPTGRARTLPAGNILARANAPAATLYGGVTDTVPLGPSNITATGSGLPHTNIQPYACINFVICLFGIFPSRN